MAIKGTAAPEVERVYARAQELCQRVGNTPQLFSVLLGQRIVHIARGELQKAYKLEEQCLTLAQSMQDPAPLLLAHRALGSTLFFLGELVTAQVHLGQSLVLYNPQQHSSLASLY